MSSSAYHDTSTKQKQWLGQRQCGGCTSHPACRVEGWNEAAGYGWKQHWLMTRSAVISCKCAVQGKIYAISTQANQDNANQTSQHLLSFPPWASPCSSCTQPWGAVAAVAGCDQQGTEAPGPCTMTLCRAAASPASSPSTTNPFPVPLPVATRCNFSCLFFLCNLFRISVLSSGCF